MNLRTLLTDDDAVSPVIGVILMVAITVILAAVIGTFVLGIGTGTNTTPQASFDFEYNASNGTVRMTHTGGDTFTTENTGIPGKCSAATAGNGLGLVGSSNGSIGATDQCWPTPIGAGDAQYLGVNGGDEIRIVWAAPDGGKSQTVGNFQVPA